MSTAPQQKSLEAAAAKDAKELGGLAANTFAGLSKKLNDKAKQMEALSAKYQQVCCCVNRRHSMQCAGSRQQPCPSHT